MFLKRWSGAEWTWSWTFNLHFQETFFVSRICQTYIRYRKHKSFNLHFQETFFVSGLISINTFASGFLSISIFRRLSLFLCTYNLPEGGSGVFQSPFSGDFLCFGSKVGFATSRHCTFQSPFSGDFLCFLKLSWDHACPRKLSISIFRRLSLFRNILCLP